MILGILFALVPAVSATAEDGCDGDFAARLKCWTERSGDQVVTLTLDHALRLDGTKEGREQIVTAVAGRSERLEVQVPAGVSTGEGGTLLLVLADRERRLVDPDARIDRLSSSTLKEFTDVCTATRKPLCDLIGPGEPAQVSGETLINSRQVTEHRSHVAGSQGDTDSAVQKWLLPGTATVLALLLAALFVLVRRTHRPAVATATAAATPDPERTTRLRVTPHRRTPAPRSGPTRPAVVRTDLHPQGYVELDRVLYRALWAEPGQTPPPPGSRVDVAPEPDSDVLQAFPPAAGRHAHAR
ncbi:hypothetical protein HLK59_19320 [Streptomyces sp. S3(2020)]|uniref:hypothetical protein n=1 Tax=Streptomyces sp. S3(2020) TaxID=2732044 RepID=UPI0014882947|nr:hypothetical protein [Streptomyces sp. S3(2020)]NNN32472.1 hypothetical protein [Streptomyces sp. S3(2020)]